MENNNKSPQTDARAALEQVFTLLKARDDTSKFVGLSLLRSILDTNEDLRSDTKVIASCWAAVPNKFLVRLMRSGASSSEEAKNMQDLAVAVIHSFVSLLPYEKLAEGRMIELLKPVIDLTSSLGPAPQMLAFQILQSIASSPSGASAFAKLGDSEEFKSPALSNERYLKEYLKLCSIAWRTSNDSRIESSMMTALRKLEEKDLPLLLESLAMVSEELSFLDDREFVEYSIRIIQRSVTAKPSTQVRNAAIRLSSTILQRSSDGSKISVDLFNGAHVKLKDESKPFAYIFIQYILIDLRSTIPSLMANLASPIYTTDSLRLAACYDIVGAFTMYLISIMDSDDSFPDRDYGAPSLTPDLLLRLRKDLSETFSLALEFLRDRWDAIISGASGLDPGARRDPKAPAMLTWENPRIVPEEDPIILSSLRALSLWIREDDNEQLSRQAIDLSDLLAALYESSMRETAKVDFRHPILVLLQGLMRDHDEAVGLLLEQNAWVLLAQDLDRYSMPLRIPDVGSNVPSSIHDLLAVMLMIVESDAVPQSRESWMAVVQWGAELDVDRTYDASSVEIWVEIWQLAVAIVTKAPSRLKKLSANWAEVIKQKAQKLKSNAGNGDVFEEGLLESLEDIISSM